MLYWALIFLSISLLFGVLASSGWLGAASWLPQTLFVVFMVLFLLSLFADLRERW